MGSTSSIIAMVRHLHMVTSLLAMVLTKAQPTEHRSCTTPHYTPGQCVGLRQCPTVLGLLTIPGQVQGYLRELPCTSDTSNTMVCCPEMAPVFGDIIPTYNNTDEETIKKLELRFYKIINDFPEIS